MYDKSARYYDAIYSYKDYANEAAILTELIRARNAGAQTLLDVACGTGKHLKEFRNSFECAGLEYEPEMAAIGREANPGIPIQVGDMRQFCVDTKFDAVTCLFSAIGYAGDVQGLDSAVECMARHLNPGGVLIVEPWIAPEDFYEGRLHAQHTDQPDLKITRMTVSRVIDGVACMDMHHLVGTPEGVTHFVESHRLTLYTDSEYRSAFQRASLEPEFVKPGLTGRGLYVGSLTA